MDINKKILKTIKYFSFFAYQPTLAEIHTFLQAKISKNELNIVLERMVKQKQIANWKLLMDDRDIYTPVEYSISSQNSKVKSQKLKSKVKSNNEAMKQCNNLNNRKQISKSKLNSPKFKLYIKLLSFFPQIKLVGLSGSISMMNAKEDDDIDLFVITAKNRLFTGRFIALMLAQLMGLRRNRESSAVEKARYRKFFNGKQKTVKNLVSSLSSNNETMKQWNNHVRNRVCLNLFFDENNLKVPKFKQTEFVGHEVLQMRPIIVKGNTYEGFLKANEWVFRLFPNAKEDFHGLKADLHGYQRKSAINLRQSLGDWLENFLKNLQLILINRHRTTEIITSTQLWFHPDDFEKKIFTD
ncbi:MAG: hypothetical protein UR54_C0020G0005 [Candidatus Roizmanbacteria bacterium GW2011_GWA2_34_18]|uniref:Polymerase nucleotidyl transferase domain-containing protein n=1 Tax=Candidatus Roizmanbacteria bacterium GW2011_GWA2_34_18 TaxID=1618477 RepID=A0A0G0DY35_9BACT|nr:MAG: hypothetical protein UR54_C0020G0005 [Candidatus Roizmanbacteria bacterium GW2011_GWA2_34_18]